jgi:hypothetical protein
MSPASPCVHPARRTLTAPSKHLCTPASQGQPHVTVVKLQKSGGVVKRETQERREARNSRVRDYFYGPGGRGLTPMPFTVRADQLKVFSVGGCGGQGVGWSGVGWGG